MYKGLSDEEVIAGKARKCRMFLWEIVEKYADDRLKKELRRCKRSRTFKTINEDNNDFFLKSPAELMYLLDKEYQGDWEAWKKQAGLDN